jgi:hypothetical protein
MEDETFIVSDPLLEKAMQEQRRIIRELQMHEVPVSVIGNMSEEEQQRALAELNNANGIEAQAIRNALRDKFQDS